MNMRVFIAMDVKDEGSIANMLKVQREFMSLGLNAKPVSKEQLHFTLLFLGEIDSIMLERVKERLSNMIFEPVNVVYRGVGAFPSMKHPRIIWVGVDPNTTSKLTDIARGVEDRLKPLGFKSDKQFTPHITLLRVKEGNSNRTRSRRSEDVGGDALATAIGKHSSTYFGSDTLDEIKVKKSDLMREGPVYTDMFSIKASSGLGSK
ncbi:RNA 2',3'-cyclic phosphodiesterase [Candidatus Nitrosocaldus islandicus]|jgi:2'-5' RNA ligase|uniref:RNA 2',3'-cyclic phosphodiesterase n=2 Tax=Candidatus Nitrosocaldus cavascurensis TaxID=2058097 RepID=A0A2K5ATF4_9ARCH|nr:RNA 2',3'-cyclic phosphodiesterase [Candidatus Nitrosocaldus islandicus]SPC34913.1 putative RNA 2',3'-cyclic phosphodiesterase [Candidatus Nitrosocaldus cavascurensis]